ncbi:MAG: hypothetical protein FWE06_09175 [Oscillospiraceae bacterium]|nr:hypothetical protein [Oscillospiraceae bacterium]
MSHAILLVSNDADALLQAALQRGCQALAPTDKDPKVHPDCHILDNQGKDITVDLVRAWRQTAHYLPNEAAQHVFIMPHADRMNQAAQNALLSLLEEPPTPCLFLLLCRSQDALLPTVRSRLQITTMRSRELGIQNEAATVWAESVYAALGNELALLKQLLSVEKLPRIELCQYLECLLAYIWAQKGLTNRDLFIIIEHVKAARATLDSNVGNGHVLAALCANIATA